jgi:hypothetical protein
MPCTRAARLKRGEREGMPANGPVADLAGVVVDGVLHLRDRLAGERGLVEHSRAPQQQAIARHDVVILSNVSGKRKQELV